MTYKNYTEERFKCHFLTKNKAYNEYGEEQIIYPEYYTTVEVGFSGGQFLGHS